MQYEKIADAKVLSITQRTVVVAYKHCQKNSFGLHNIQNNHVMLRVHLFLSK